MVTLPVAQLLLVGVLPVRHSAPRALAMEKLTSTGFSYCDFFFVLIPIPSSLASEYNIPQQSTVRSASSVAPIRGDATGPASILRRASGHAIAGPGIASILALVPCRNASVLAMRSQGIHHGEAHEHGLLIDQFGFSISRTHPANYNPVPGDCTVDFSTRAVSAWSGRARDGPPRRNTRTGRRGFSCRSSSLRCSSPGRPPS